MSRKTIIILSAFFSLWALMLTYGISVRNPLSILGFIGLYLLFSRASEKNAPRRKWPVYVAAFIYTAAVVLVKYETASENFESALFRIALLIIMSVGWYALFVFILRIFVANKPVSPKFRLFSDTFSVSPRRLLLISFLVCFLCYLPWYLYSYPGIFDPDPMSQIEQVMGIRPPSNHHPIAHTLLIGIFYHIAGIFTDNMNARISLYTFFQMTFFAFCAAYVIYTLYKVYRLRISLCMTVLAFYALIPFMAVQSILVTKDTVFAGILMLFCCELSRMVYTEQESSPDDSSDDSSDNPSKNASNNEKKHHRNWISWLRFVILGVLMCIFRSNGWYAFLMFAVCFFIIYVKEWKKSLLYIVPVIGIALLIKGPVMNAYGVVQPDMAESLHVPEQQIARVIVNDREISETDMKMLTDLMDVSRVKDLYVPWFADNIKELVRAGNPNLIGENKAEYLKLWIRLGLRYPGDYILAWKDLVENVIYPEGDYDVAIIEGVFPNELGLYHQPIIGGKILVKLRELTIKLGTFIPLYGFLWSMGSYAWILLLFATVILSQGNDTKRLIILLPAIAVICTLLLAIPSAVMFRYSFSYAVLVPFGFCCGKKNQGSISS